MGQWYSYSMYAIRQSSKGWSDIIAVCDSKAEAKAFCQEMYRLNDGIRANWRIEKLPKYGYFEDIKDDEEQLPF